MTRWKLRGLSLSLKLGPVFGCPTCGSVVQYAVKPPQTPFCAGHTLTDGAVTVIAPSGPHEIGAMKPVDPHQFEL